MSNENEGRAGEAHEVAPATPGKSVTVCGIEVPASRHCPDFWVKYIGTQTDICLSKIGEDYYSASVSVRASTPEGAAALLEVELLRHFAPRGNQ